MDELVKTKNVALALSSGGARGLAHIGAIEELKYPDEPLWYL
jgi:predicted acylesterase/phospholipase RssA